jgi:hypothetical protein
MTAFRASARRGNALRDVPTDFEAGRDPFNGNISGCGIGSTGGGCVNGALASLSSSVFRARGVNATVWHDRGPSARGDRRRLCPQVFIAARGTVLGLADGTWTKAGMSMARVRLRPRSSFAVAVYSACTTAVRLAMPRATRWAQRFLFPQSDRSSGRQRGGGDRRLQPQGGAGRTRRIGPDRPALQFLAPGLRCTIRSMG